MKASVLFRATCAFVFLSLAPLAQAQLTLIEIGGGPLSPNHSTAAGSTAFGRDEIGGGGFPIHKIPNVRDGIYGNGNSWIGDSLNSFIGISLGATPVSVGRVAWGRDNTATFGDRTAGAYTLQFTTVPNPSAVTPDVDWTTVGVVNYPFQGAPGSPLSMSLRHAWSFPAVNATGIRLIVPGNSFGDGGCIDELEISGPAAPALTLRAVGGTAMRAANLALGGSIVAFGRDEIFGGTLPIHKIPNIRDGVHGNNNSWIGDSESSFVGLAFGTGLQISRVAFGRDSTGTFADRAAGNYLLQFTTVPSPDATTPDASWTTLGPVFIDPAEPARHLRHEYEFAPVTATGIRLFAPGNGAGSGSCIDELEVYGVPLALAQSGGGFAPGNIAPGGTAFGRDELHYEPPATPGMFIHLIEDINDGIYGNNNSWIGNSDESFVGVAFNSSRMIEAIAFSRDNTGTYTDRSAGKYVLQYTTVPAPNAATPDASWTTLGVAFVADTPGSAARKVYAFPAVAATGVRVIAPGNGVPSGACLDELEVYQVNTPPVAQDNGMATTQNQPATISFVKLLANDTDADGDTLAVTSAATPSMNGGVVTLGASGVTYTPPTGFTGTDQFSYTIGDGRSGSSTAQVVVLVVAGNLPSQNQISLTPTPGGFLVRFAGIPGRAYQIQRSADLMTWITIATPTAPIHGILDYEDTSPPPGQAFYRTVSP